MNVDVVFELESRRLYFKSVDDVALSSNFVTFWLSQLAPLVYFPYLDYDDIFQQCLYFWDRNRKSAVGDQACVHVHSYFWE